MFDFYEFFCVYLSQPKQQLRITSGAFEGKGNQQHEVAVVSLKNFLFCQEITNRTFKQQSIESKNFIKINIVEMIFIAFEASPNNVLVAPDIS